VTSATPNGFRVVVTDHAFPSLDAERTVLASASAELHDAQCRSEDQLVEAVRDADAILVQFAPITAAVIASMQRCRSIVRYGIGVDNVDIAAATRAGIPVSNVPDYALDEVADHAVTLLLALARKLPQVMQDVRAGRWELSPRRPLYSLRGRTLGLGGFGGIGRRVAARAQSFGLRVQAYDPYLPDEAFRAAGVERVDWDGLLRTSDAISIHLPLTDGTRALFDDAAFAAMRAGALLVNTARGGVVDTDALVRALDAGRLAGAGLDVLAEEPPAADAAIVHHANAIVTSHCAWYTEDALVRLQRHAAEEVARALRGDPPKYALNPEALSR